ncbi:MAG: hypothetical protein CL920_31640 [Deltaproteobacteria bacterium]|nr:hypothetical protein [Deltaproteobacteria bacterium]MBK07310.1 hypothetical protein [Deltaproteobacteria bacterium]MBU53272.1 hypothetical protein [Deltaproteobacteria bacterium]|tara:strand:- start:27136 stop:29763 length:2628 start_codon:yes stop_codon:yes gene_type:complete
MNEPTLKASRGVFMHTKGYLMDVVCEKCSAVYELDLTQVKGPSVRVKCSTCGHTFRVFKSEPEPSPKAEVLEDWNIRFRDGASAQVPDQATLQRWIIDGKVKRDDEISKDGKQWQLIGNVESFVPFFELIEKLGAANLTTPAPQSANISLQSANPKSTIEFGYTSATATPAGSHPIATELQATEHAVEAAPSQALFVPVQTATGEVVSVQAISATDLPAAQVVPVQTTTGQVAAVQIASLQAAVHATPSQSALPAVVEQPAQPVHPVAPVQPVGLAPPVEVTPAAEPAPATAPAPVAEPVPVEPAPVKSEELTQVEVAAAAEPQQITIEPPVAVSVPASTDNGAEGKPLSSSGEWFLGSSDSLPDEQYGPSFSSSSSSLDASSEMRDFTDYSESRTMDAYDGLDDDIGYKPTPWGKIFGVLLLLGVLSLGGMYFFSPATFSSMMLSLGFIDEHPDALKKVKEARAAWAPFTPDAFRKAGAFLTSAVEIQGKPFPSQQATKAQLSLFRAEYALLKLNFETRKMKRLQAQANELIKQIQALNSEDKQPKGKKAKKEKEEKETELKAKLQPILQALKDHKAVFQKADDAVEKHRRDAKMLLDRLQSIKQPNAYTRLALMHLISLSKDPEALKRSMDATKQLFKKNRPAVLDKVSFYEGAQMSRRKKYVESEALLQKSIKEHGDMVLPRLLRAWGLIAQDKLLDAKTILSAVESAQKGHPLVKWMRKRLEAPVAPKPATTPETPKKGAPAKQPTKRPAKPAVKGNFKSLFRRAERLRRRESLRSALRYYRLAMKLKKTSRLYSGMGWCLLDLGRSKSAKRYFDRAMRMSKRNGSAYYGLGLTYRRMRQKGKARQMLQRYLKLFPRGRDAGEVRLILRSL